MTTSEWLTVAGMLVGAVLSLGAPIAAWMWRIDRIVTRLQTMGEMEMAAIREWRVNSQVDANQIWERINRNSDRIQAVTERVSSLESTVKEMNHR